MITVTAFLLRACSQARYALGARRNAHSSGLRYWGLAERQGGPRLIVRRDGKRTRVFTRRGFDWTGRFPWFPHGMANAITAGASDLAMVDIMKIGGVTGWLSAMAQAEAAALPLSNHTFVEPRAHVMAVSPMASWFEYLDIAGAVLTERLLPVDGTVTARGPGLGLDWDEHAVARYAFS